MSNLELFPQRLKALRKEYGYKVDEVAKILNVSAPTIFAYENGNRSPYLPGLVKLAQLYHCSTDYLLGIDSQELETSDVVIKINVMKQRLNELEEFVMKGVASNA